MNFREVIRKKYEREVNPKMSEADWQSFLQHRSLKENRRKRFVYIPITVGLLLLIVFSIYFITLPDQISELKFVTDEFPKGQNDLNPIADLKLDTFATNKRLQNNLPNSNQLHESSKTYIAFNKKQKNPSSSADFELQKQMTQIVRTDIDLDKENSKEEKFEISEQSRSSDLEMSKTSPLPVLGRIAELKTVGREITPFKISTTRVDSWNPGNISAMINGGLALPFHDLTLDEQAHQFGILGYYHLNDNIRLKTGLEVSVADFIAVEMNPKIGVKFIESPGDKVVFYEAVVQSVGLSFDLGLDYRLWHHNNWSMYTGASYRLAKELIKGIEYEFRPDGPGGPENEIYIRSDKGDHYFEPFNIKFEVGLSYQTQVGGFNFALSYPLQLSNNKVDLLNQLQFNFGISHTIGKKNQVE